MGKDIYQIVKFSMHHFVNNFIRTLVVQTLPRPVIEFLLDFVNLFSLPQVLAQPFIPASFVVAVSAPYRPGISFGCHHRYVSIPERLPNDPVSLSALSLASFAWFGANIQASADRKTSDNLTYTPPLWIKAYFTI